MHVVTVVKYIGNAMCIVCMSRAMVAETHSMFVSISLVVVVVVAYFFWFRIERDNSCYCFCYYISFFFRYFLLLLYGFFFSNCLQYKIYLFRSPVYCMYWIQWQQLIIVIFKLLSSGSSLFYNQTEKNVHTWKKQAKTQWKLGTLPATTWFTKHTTKKRIINSRYNK